jgi:hypothetical protein
MGIAAAIRLIARAFVGEPTELPSDLVRRYPEVRRARWRRGGLPVRVGGWCLGRSSVSAITLWRTIWLAPDIEPSGELLLHELRHVDQFAASRLFPLAYLWQSVRHGYFRNRFEVDACAYAAQRIRES